MKILILFLVLASSALAAEAPKPAEPPATLEVLMLRLSNVEQRIRILELEYPLLEKAKADITAEIEKRKAAEKK